MARYGRLRLLRGEAGLRLVADDPTILAEASRNRDAAPLLGARVAPDAVEVPPGSRGRLKQALTKMGWPVEDLAGYVEGESLDLALRDTAASGRPFSLRSFQEQAVAGYWVGGSPQGGSGVVVLPCGAGKTVVGMGVMERVRAHTLILVTSIVAARQWIRELLDKTTLEPEQIGEYSGETKQIRPVTIATYQVLTRRRGGAYPHLMVLGEYDWGLVVYDEVHLLPAPVFRMTAEIQSTRRLGLTATLVREDGREDDVFSLIGPKRFDAPWRDLENQGWIAPATCTEIRVEMPPDERMDYAVGEPARRYRIAACTTAKHPVLDSLVARHRNDRVLVIGQYIDQLEQVAARLGAPLITGETATRERERLYAGFRSAELPLLVVSKVANFSIDLPEANVAIQISGSFGSRQEEAQRLGRILRPKADGGQAHFYTIVTRDTRDQEFAMRRQLFLAEQGYRYTISAGEDLMAPT
jgi:DNA excision repair protein ERCC-3